jgi:hypothetical protein
MPRRRKTKIGRPVRWTADVAFQLGLSLGRGRYWTQAAEAAGIGKSTLRDWARRGRAGDERFIALAKEMQACRERYPWWGGIQPFKPVFTDGNRPATNQQPASVFDTVFREASASETFADFSADPHEKGEP